VKRWHTAALSALGLVLLGHGRAPAVERELLDRAVQRGVRALVALQTSQGTWVFGQNETSMTAFAGLTLLECGIGPREPVVARAAAATRAAVPRMTATYALVCSILLLDRLGDPADEPLIELMGIRLLHGQKPDGAWGYECPNLGTEAESRLTGGQRAADPARAEGTERVRALSAEAREVLALYAARARAREPANVDHSNTQFAAMGLWVVRRHGVPVDPALRTLEDHFRKSQNSDGGWGYTPETPSTPTMTAAGLIGLAVGDGITVDLCRQRGTSSAETIKDAALDKALACISAAIGKPQDGKSTDPVAPASGKTFYFLWSVERLAMCLGLDTIGRKDWYGWGAEVLLASQGSDGLWRGGESPDGPPDTCMALLFLVRSNLVKDLSDQLRGLFRDPGQVTLRATSGSGAVGKTTRPAVQPDGKRGSEPGAREPLPEATQLARDIVRADGSEFNAVLERSRDGRGVVHTEALAAAIGQLMGERRRQARDALAERLSRLRAGSLAAYLKDEDAEIRRGAALALAMKESKEHVPDLINLLADPVEGVALGARAALKELTQQDFGPAPGGTREDRARAHEAWRTWWKSRGK
jgi:hypothetical protein